MSNELINYQHHVEQEFEEFNDMFLHLPFHGVPDAGLELPKFTEFCLKGLEQGIAPDKIVEDYFSGDPDLDKLFLFLQFVERQVVLFDALEDNSFGLMHDLKGDGTLENFLKTNKVRKDYETRIVLTAHPTQFYSSHVLDIIHDMVKAIQSKNIERLKVLFLQLSKTPFLNKEQPTPIDEAEFLINFLRGIFYPALIDIHREISDVDCALRLGFWPGGDRDGNPNVTAEITLEVARLLKQNILECYRHELDRLQRRLTFKNILEPLKNIEDKLEQYDTSDELIADLMTVKQTLIDEHDALFSERIDHLITAVKVFGFYFATLDLRQDSRINKAYKENEDVIASFKTIPIIQKENGEAGLHRYIISNTQTADDIFHVLHLAELAGLDEFNVDVVPLFETIEDLKNAPAIMTECYENATYKKHLQKRKNHQTIMVGFSDGTKDGGYITANWSIYKAKKVLTQVARETGIEVIFFDGRGGPPARGGGNTHKFYQAHGKDISEKEIHLTIQGQTISSDYGTLTSAKYNLEQLFTAGLENHSEPLSKAQTDLMQKLSDISAEKYEQLKQHPDFLHYLEHATPLTYYGDLNIASRPPKRGTDTELSLDDLRAIPFVGAWSQMKQNVPGYYGVGAALKEMPEDDLKALYKESLYFKTLIDNTMQCLEKSNFKLTSYLKEDPRHGALWQLLFEEAELTKSMILKITDLEELLGDSPVIKHSIVLRESIVLPLLVIQQFALLNVSKGEVYKKLILKSMATNINASRNSA